MLQVENYVLSAALFVRLLGLIYFFAFGAFLFQIKGLIGANGILPVEGFLRSVKRNVQHPYRLLPTLFWWNASDRMLVALVAAGTLCGLLLFLGFYPPLMLLLLYILYLSLYGVGQDFLSFGWELFLLEITILAFFLSLTAIPNIFVWIALNFLLFRFHFEGGVVKFLSGDPNWRNLTAVAYHYQTQPLPNTQAWYVHKLPMPFHKFSCALMLFIEIPFAFALFWSIDARAIVYVGFVGLQLAIWWTGNFSFLNYLTVAFCTILLSDHYLQPLFSWLQPSATPTPLPLEIGVSIIGSLLLLAQALSFIQHFRPTYTLRRLLSYLQPWCCANRYGIFAVMTTQRIEIIIEGSEDGIHWKEYLFWYKPSEVERRPRRISPYQPRIDWQAWFLPFSRARDESWLYNFLYRLLLGTPEVVKLLRHNPFFEKPPRFIRAIAYDYVFSDWKTKKETGAWWIRKRLGRYTEDLTLKMSDSNFSDK